MTVKPIAPFDLAAIRRDFPILDTQVYGQPLVYLDNAATTQKPRQVIQALTDYYETANANVHRGIHYLSAVATEQYETARKKVADFLGAPTERSIIFTRGATEALNLVATSFGSLLGEDDEIIVSIMEHHSNFVPWQLLAQRRGCKLKFVRLLPDGQLDMDHLHELISPKTALIAVTHMSNVLGTINPVAEIARLAHEVGAKILVDGAQSTPHIPVNVQELDVDFFVVSAHKMLGPTGIGCLYGKEEILEQMPPYHGGGEMIHTVTTDLVTYAELPYKFEAGTPNIADTIAWGAAIDYLQNVGMDKIHTWETHLARYAIQKMQELEGMTIYGLAPCRGGVVSFNPGEVHPHDLSHFLDQKGVAIRAGHHCAQPLLQHLGVGSTSRASFYLYNTVEEVDQFVEELRIAQEFFDFG